MEKEELVAYILSKGFHVLFTLELEEKLELFKKDTIDEYLADNFDPPKDW